MVIPRLFSEVLRGEAFYFSIPKMKTNLYTGVTLSAKNSMGILSYNLRQQSHHYALDQKLVDISYLLQPDLVLIDGIVGGEGNCPAPVEPVLSRVIVSGNHSLETDRVAARLMGFNPAEIPLIRIADENGFGDPLVQVIGEEKITPYRPADPSLLGAWMQANFPNVRVLIGHSRNGAAHSFAQDGGGADALCRLECACRGGCQAVTRYAFDMLFYEGKKRDVHLTLVLGAGVDLGGIPRYYDARGNAYSVAEIAKLEGKKVAIGACARGLKGAVDRHIDGCMPYPNAAHMLLHQASGTLCTVISPRNRYLLPALLATLQVCQRRKALLRSGQRIDVPLPQANTYPEPREFSPDERQRAFLFEPFPPLAPAEIKALCAAEDRAMFATFFP
jgi:hypothetical protein